MPHAIDLPIPGPLRAPFPRRVFPILLATIVVAAANPAARGQVTEAQVRRGIESGVRFLRSEQLDGGGWGENPVAPGGASALCILALINSGVSVDDPAIRKGMDYLRNKWQSTSGEQGTYSVSLMLMVFCSVAPKRDRLLIERLAKWLERAQSKPGSRQSGAWSYGITAGDNGDSSNAQFALLGLHEAEQAGVAVNDNTWRMAQDYFKSIQTTNGGFGYKRGDETPLGSMTCAGLSSLIIANGRLNSPEADVVNGEIRCCLPPTVNDGIERGLAWLARYFSVAFNPSQGQRRGFYLYYMYGMERVGRLSGRRFIGRHDWYREGAEALLRQQNRFNGSWTGDSSPHVDTAFALLFLSKGRRPILFSRVKHGEGDDWNRHREGLPHLVRRVEQAWKTPLTWQTIDIGAATTADLLLSPVLLLSGSEALSLSEEQKQRIKEYVEQGGFLFCEGMVGCGCGGGDFDSSLRALLAEMFPDSPLRKLPPDHAAWFADAPVRPDDLPDDLWLYGVDACCRTGVIYCPHPLSGYWELDHPRRAREYAPKIRAQVGACSLLAQNILAYATNRQLKGKLDAPNIALADSNVGRERGVLQVPKLTHGGGSDDAPNALRNLLQFSGESLQMRVTLESPMMSPLDDKLYRFPIVFMHGRRAFTWTEAERRALRKYLTDGGFLVADSICASRPFARSFRQELRKAIPEGRFQVLPATHPALTRELDGFDLSSVTLRDPAKRVRGGGPLETRLVQTTPTIEGLWIEDRLAVVFSPLDLSCALENQPSLECKGYVREDAAKIGANLLLYGLQQ